MQLSRRCLLFALAAWTASSAVSARADNWCTRTYRGWCGQYYDAVQWPDQYLPHDRCAVRAPFAAMVANGWRAQNTICAYHFNEVTGELNDTGMLKLQSVLQNAPPEFRQLYVLRGNTPEITAQRMREVQEQAATISQGEGVPPVMVTTLEPRGIRGEVVSGVNTRYLENAPVPQLPQVTRSTEGM